MPINPQIPLSVEPPKIPNLLDSWTRAQTLKNQQKQGQINDLELQQQQQQAEDGQRIRQVYMESGGDPKEFISRLKTSGINPQSIMSIEKSVNDATVAEKERIQKLNDQQRKAETERLDQIRGLLVPIDEEKDDAKASDMFKQAYQIAKAQGWIDDKTSQAINIAMGQGFSRQGLAVLRGSLSTAQNQYKEQEKAIRAQATMLRAQAYSQNIQNEIANTDFKNEMSRKRLELSVAEYERLLAKDDNMDELARLRLKNDIDIAREKIKVSREAESGRNKRSAESNATRLKIAREGEAGKVERLQMTRESIEKVAAVKGTSAANVQKNFNSAVSLAKKLNGDDWEDYDSETQDGIINDIFDSFMENTPVNVVETEDSDAFFPDKAKTVKPKQGSKPSPVSGVAPSTPVKESSSNKNSKSETQTSLQLNDQAKNAMQVGRWYAAKGSKGTTIYIKKNADGSVVETQEKPAGM